MSHNKMIYNEDTEQIINDPNFMAPVGDGGGGSSGVIDNDNVSETID